MISFILILLFAWCVARVSTKHLLALVLMLCGVANPVLATDGILSTVNGSTVVGGSIANVLTNANTTQTGTNPIFTASVLNSPTHFGTSDVNNVIYQINGKEPNTARNGDWVFRQSYQTNIGSGDGQKQWTWGFNYDPSKSLNKTSSNESQMTWNLETHWDPFAPAGSTRQMELYGTYAIPTNHTGGGRWFGFVPQYDYSADTFSLNYNFSVDIFHFDGFGGGNDSAISSTITRGANAGANWDVKGPITTHANASTIGGFTAYGGVVKASDPTDNTNIVMRIDGNPPVAHLYDAGNAVPLHVDSFTLCAIYGSTTNWITVDGNGLDVTNNSAANLGVHINKGTVSTYSTGTGLKNYGGIVVGGNVPTSLTPNQGQIVLADGSDNVKVQLIYNGNGQVKVGSAGKIGFTASSDGSDSLDGDFAKSSSLTLLVENNLIAKGYMAVTNGFASYYSNQLPVVTISVGASPFSYTNTSGRNGYVIVDGATAFSATWLDTTVQSSLAGGVTIPLQNGEWTKVTYTVAPGMFFKPF